MRFAISIPQHVGEDGFDPGAFRSHVARVEELGFHSAWTQEQILGSARTLSPLETMTYAAACTDRLRLGCAVFVTPLHNPLHLAKAIGSLDHLSRGRVEVGVASGGRGRPFAAFGVEFNLSVLAVLSYRGISFWLPTLPGAVAYFQLRRTVARWREEQSDGPLATALPGSGEGAGALGSSLTQT